ncbi:MAG: hypothetical protein KC550_01600 [Nanoarchaeota archaeon]|nr:hypothetical protein [Nanoarchaeota archaeon]
MSLDLKVIEVRKLLKKSKNVVMFFDGDADGFTSYFQLKRAFPQIKEGFIMPKDFEIQNSLVEKVNVDVDLIVIFDVPTISSGFLEGVKSKKVIWADHHPFNSKELISKFDIVHLNPLNYDETDNRPSCFLAYLVSNMKDNLALVSLGSVSDFYILDLLVDFYEYDPKLFNVIFEISDEKRKELFEFLKSYDYRDSSKDDLRRYWVCFLTYEAKLIIFKNLFDLIFKMLEEDENISEAIKFIEEKSLFDLKSEINSGKGFLFEKYAYLRKKYLSFLNKALKKKYGSLVFYDYENDFSYTRQLAEELAFRVDSFKVVCVCFKKPEKEYISGSFRGRGVAVNVLIDELLEGLDGNGGGHEFSAGFRVHRKNYAEFKKRLLKKTF